MEGSGKNRLMLLVLVAIITPAWFQGSAPKGEKKSKPEKATGWIEECPSKKSSIDNEPCFVFQKDHDPDVWKVRNEADLKAHTGHHVAVTGTFDESTHSLRVESATESAEQQPCSPKLCRRPNECDQKCKPKCLCSS